MPDLRSSRGQNAFGNLQLRTSTGIFSTPRTLRLDRLAGWKRPVRAQLPQPILEDTSHVETDPHYPVPELRPGIRVGAQPVANCRRGALRALRFLWLARHLIEQRAIRAGIQGISTATCVILMHETDK